MSYIPKSAYQILETSGADYVTPDGKPYVGYYILTSDGAFVGNDIRVPNKIKLRKSLSLTQKVKQPNNLFIIEDNVRYFALKPAETGFLKTTRPIVSTKTKPTEKDYEKGFYVRYFCKRNNSETAYFEINKFTYKQLITNSYNFDFNLYSADKIVWALDGDVLKANSNILKRKSRFFPNISSLFPKLNEYQKLRYANEGELTYEDGTPYVGFYHLHLGKPMEGQFHSSRKHKNLIFIDKNTLYKENKQVEQSYESHGAHPEISDFPPEQELYIPPKIVREQITQRPTSTPTPNVTPSIPTPSIPTPSTPVPSTPPTSTPSYGGGGSSGGGGGGY